MRSEKPFVVGMAGLFVFGGLAEPASAKSFFKKLGRDLNRVAIDVGKTGGKAVQDAGKTGEKAFHDGIRTSEKGGQDLGRAGQTVIKFAAREVKDTGKTLADADKRIREGKFIDAAWHAATDPFKHTERNAAKAAQESNIVRTVGQVAASAYGGAGGAAAFSTWYAYRTTGDARTALRAGAITGVTSLAFARDGEMPAKTGQEIAGKTLAAGVVGGAAVVAAGGKSTDVRDGILLAAATSLAQTEYENMTKHPIDARVSKGEAFCKSTPGAACAPPGDTYVRDPRGRSIFDNDTPRVDITKMDSRVPHVGKFSDDKTPGFFGLGERSGFMTAVSRVPGMNAMAYFHDTWSTTWKMPPGFNEFTILPATVLTYAGTGAPMVDRIRTIATKDEQREAE